MSSKKKICGKYSVEEVADKVVEFAKVYNNIIKEMPKFPMIQYILEAFGSDINTTDKQVVVQFFEAVMDGNRQIVRHHLDQLKSNTQKVRQ